MATSPVMIHADTDSLKLLSKKMLEAAPAARAVAQASMRAEATKVKDDAASRASFSERIAASGKVRMNGFNVTVSFGGGDAWIAVPIENRGVGNVTHPTFGHAPITNKGSHPAFLLPAFAGRIEEIIGVLTEAVEKAITDGLDL